MHTLDSHAQARAIRFDANRLIVSLSDEREISVPIDRVDWLNWLAKATPEQRDNWAIESGGFAVYWDDLDDGVEIVHLLTMEPLA